MSLDIYLVSPTQCPHCGKDIAAGGAEIFSKNYTHNVTPMWSKAGVYDALYMSDGHLAKQYIEALEKGVEHMKNNPTEYEPLNPPNKWGSYDTALPWLEKVLQAFKDNPDAMIQVSK